MQDNNTEQQKEQKRIYNNTIIEVADYFALRISNGVLALCMGITFTWFMFSKYRNPSAVYVMIMALAGPGIISYIMKNRFANIIEKEKDLPLPEFRKRFNFSVLKYRAASSNFFIIVTMLALWHYSYTKTPAAFAPAQFIPMLALFLYSLLRLVIWGVMSLYFKLFPLKALKK